MYLMTRALRHAQSESSRVQIIMSDFIETNIHDDGIDLEDFSNVWPGLGPASFGPSTEGLLTSTVDPTFA
jgi:hypothetical protein